VELIILTRVSADAGVRRFIEQRLQPWCVRSAFGPLNSPGRVMRSGWQARAEWSWSSAAGAALGHFSLIRFSQNRGRSGRLARASRCSLNASV